MDDVEQHRDAHAVSGIDQRAQTVRCAEAGGNGIEIGDLIAEGAIVGMLHDGHDLQGVITEITHAGQDPLAELIEGADRLALLCHTDVALIDQRRFARGRIGILPDVSRLVNNDAAPTVIGGILLDTANIEGNTLKQLTVVPHDRLDTTAVPQRVFTGQTNLKHALSDGSQTQIEPTPTDHITRKVYLLGGGCPLTVDPPVLGSMETEILIAVGKITQRATLADQLLSLLVIPPHAQVNVPLVGQQLWIVFKNLVGHIPSPEALTEYLCTSSFYSKVYHNPSKKSRTFFRSQP